MSNNTRNFLKQIHFLVHSLSSNETFKSLIVFITIINKTQELDLIDNINQATHSELSTLRDLIQQCAVINAASDDEVILIILGFFVLHILFVLFFLYSCFSTNTQSYIITFLHNFILYYNLIFYIPIIYSSLLFFSDQSICNSSSLCSETNKIILIIICFFNLLISIHISFIHLYFSRAETLMGDNHILTLNFSFLINVSTQLATFACILFKSIEMLQGLRFALILIKYLLLMFQLFNKINCRIYLLIDLIAILTSISFISGLSLYEYLLVISLAICFFYQLADLIENHYIMKRDQGNLITLQKIEEAIKLDSKIQSKFILLMIKKIHNCNKCKYFQQMTECIFRKMANNTRSSSFQIVTLYCAYVSNHAPLKALIRLLLLNPSNVYYKCASQHLAKQLNNRCKQFQKEALSKISVKNTGEHQNSLDVQTVYSTSHSAQDVFPTIIEAIQAKITFWNKLINGYQDISNCLQEAIISSKSMMKCKELIERRFDLSTNKLSNAQSTDIISLRIIQIYYCGVYTNQFQAFSIEKTIDELLKSERFKQDETLDNIQLVQDRLIILKSSFVKKRGDLIDVNYKQLAKFLNEPEDKVKMIKHCSQIMPSFLACIHDQLMNNYLQNGYSKLMIHGESSFFQNISGFIEPCNINLFNFFDGQNDFILNMILTKEQTNNETILFGIDGRILGITSQFFNEIIKSNTTFIKSILTLKTSDTLQLTNINEFLAKQPLIQYYIPNIMSQVEELKNQICQSQNFLLNNQRSSWVIPNNHFECLASTSQLLQQFKKKSFASSGSHFRSYKSQTLSKYTVNTNNTAQEQYDENEIGKEMLQKISIESIPIIILHPDLYESIATMVSFGDIQKQNVSLGIFYSLSFKLLKSKKENYGFFMLNVKEYKFYSSQEKSQYYTSGQTPQTIRSSNKVSQEEAELLQNSFQMSENLNRQEELIQEIRQMNNIILNVKDNQIMDQSGNNLSLDQSSLKIQLQLRNSERSNLYETSRGLIQNLSLFPKVQVVDCNQYELKVMEEDMLQIKQEFQEELYENDQDFQNQKFESNSQSVKKQSNILNKFKQTQKEKLENAADFASNPSRTSTNSTSKESMIIVQQLYFNTNLITPLKKVSFLLFLINIGMLISEVINVITINENLQQQTIQVINLIKPQNIIYYYSSILYQFWGIELDIRGILPLSDFQRYDNINTVAAMMVYGSTYLQEMNIAVPQTANKLGTQYFDLRLVQNKQLLKVQYELQNLYPVLYDVTLKQYQDNLNATNPQFDTIYTTGIMRQNIMQLIDLHNKLVVAITNDTISSQGEVKGTFLTMMLIELFSILLVVGFQLRYWLFMDHIAKSILFLVSRLNENQSLDQIARLTVVKESLEDRNNNAWKLFNFGDTIFENLDKKQNKQKVVLKQQEITSSNFRQTSALYSRIQKTQYLNRVNVFLTFCITILWTSFLLTGYLIHMQKNDNFQPSLTATLKYGQFRLNMDSVGIIGGLVKTEGLVPGNNLTYINQTYALSLLSEYKANLSPLINEVAQVILENANANNKKSRFDDILNSDICAQTPWEDMKSCNVSRLGLEYSSKDSINDVVSSGVLGYTASLVKYLNSDFNYELLNLKYDSNENNKVSIQTKAFENFFLSYYCDIQNTMLEFLNLFQIDNSEIAADINSIIQVFYLGVGIILVLFLQCLGLIWVYKSHKTITCLRQILVLLPQDLISTANIRSQAKEIHQWLY